jgi:hypothetical protein
MDVRKEKPHPIESGWGRSGNDRSSNGSTVAKDLEELVVEMTQAAAKTPSYRYSVQENADVR